MKEQAIKVSTMPSASPAPAKKKPRLLKCVFCYVIVSLAFSAAVLFAAKSGISLALKNLPVNTLSKTRFPDGQALSIGGINTPLYLADSPKSLRDFYLQYPDEISRANTSDFADYGVRRIFSRLEMTIQRYDVDAVQVKVTSGSISGAIYWIDIGLLQDVPGPEREKDVIIEPIPSR